MANGKHKGGAFERELCHALSQWWSNGERSDHFWRSANSGGRATVRNQKGKSTRGNYGDIRAEDADAANLIEFVTIELKRGYNRCTPTDLLDCRSQEKLKGFEQFLSQAITSADQAGSFGWLLIHRRDKKRAMVYFPRRVYAALVEAGAPLKELGAPRCLLRAAVRTGGDKVEQVTFAALLLDDFFGAVRREHVFAALKECS